MPTEVHPQLFHAFSPSNQDTREEVRCVGGATLARSAGPWADSRHKVLRIAGVWASTRQAEDLINRIAYGAAITGGPYDKLGRRTNVSTPHAPDPGGERTRSATPGGRGHASH
jgi:hypothetical protein